jgi:hypothetical protein
MAVPTEMLTRPERRVTPAVPPAAPVEDTERRAAAERKARRVRKLELNVAAWALGTIVITTLWIVGQWTANGPFEHFGNSGNDGDWNPTLWALVVGLWGMAVGIMALHVRFEGLRFHVAAWALGMLVLTPIWALIEWQDNGGFERFGSGSQPGEWEPWILYVGGIWALAIGVLELSRYVRRHRRPRPGVIHR